MNDGSALQLRTVTTPDDFATLAAQWDSLVRDMRRPTPFMLHAWLEAWWNNQGHERRMLAVVAFDGDELIAAVPLELEQRLGLCVAHLMGRHHAALGDILTRAGSAPVAVQLVLERIQSSGVDWMNFFGPGAGGVLTGSSMPVDLTAIRRVEAPVLEIPEGWEEAYRRNVSGKKRNLHRRRRRQLAELGEVSISVATSEPDLSAALEEAFRIHDLRWQGRRDTSEFTTPAGKAFHRAAITKLAVHGVPQLLLLRIDGTAVAFHYGMHLEGVFFNHRLAFDPAFGQASPGLITTLSAIETAADAGAVRIEFLGGDERYKIELADYVDPLYQCVGLASGRVGGLGAAFTVAAIRARLRLKHSKRVHHLYVERLPSARRALRRRRGRSVL